MLRFFGSLVLLVLAGAVVLLISVKAYGQTSEPPAAIEMPVAPEGERIQETSVCTQLIQTFKGMQLVEVSVNPKTLDAKILYLRILSKHQAVLFLVIRRGCKGHYEIVNAQSFDPEPGECPEGSTCI